MGFKKLGSINDWKGIPEALQECIELGHKGKTYQGKKNTVICVCSKCRISYTAEVENVRR